MGQGILGHVSKGVVLTKVDAAINAADRAGRRRFRDELAAADTPAKYRDLLEKEAHITPAQSNYLAAKWYEPGGWWPNPDVTFAVVQQGLIKALDLAIELNLPLDSYWLPAASSGVIEVIVTKSAHQITRIILTPSSGELPTMPRPAPRDMWIVKPRMGNEDPQAVNTLADEFIETIHDIHEKAVTWRIRDLEETVKPVTKGRRA